MQFKIETGQKMLDLQGHNGDVAALSLRPDDKNVFVSGSVDRTARIWDLRTPGLEAGAELRGGGSKEANAPPHVILSAMSSLEVTRPALP